MPTFRTFDDAVQLKAQFGSIPVRGDSRELEAFMTIQEAQEGRALTPDERRGREFAYLAAIMMARSGELFYWNRVTTDLIAQTWVGFPNTWRLLPSDIPRQYGYAFLESPLVLARGDGEDIHVQVVSWVCLPKSLAGKDPGPKFPVTGPDGCQVCAFMFWPVGYTNGDYHAPMPSSVYSVNFGESIEEMMAYKSFRTSQFPLLHEAKAKVLGTMFTFMRQRLVAPSERRPSRALRRRLGQPPEAPRTNVMILRAYEERAAYHRDSSVTDAVDWQLQWLVRGHWRNQWYPSLKLNQPKWIMPYIKGPPDKPLVIREKAVAVTR